MKFGLSILAVSFACFVNAAFAATISATYRPSGSESGYVVSIPFEYNMRECFNDLHIGIKRGQASAPTEYVYKGKSYSAADLGLKSFSNVQVMGVNLTVDVHDRAMRAGEVRMTNVIPQGGSGCYGQSYSVQKSISGFDGKAASKRAGDFNLQNARVQATTIDAAIEAKIRALEADATKAAASGAATAAATGAATANESANIQTKASDAPQTAPKSVDMNKVNAETQQMIARADQGGRKAGEAVGVLGEGLGGMWDQGHGIGTGFLWQEEDYSFFLELLFGTWDVEKGDQKLPSKFIAGAFTYVAYDIIGNSPTEGAPLGKGDDEFTRMIIGVNVLNNSLGLSQFRLVFGPTGNIVDVYGPTGKRVDNMKFQLGFDVGIAGATDGYMTAFTYNLQSEVMGLHFVFKK